MCGCETTSSNVSGLHRLYKFSSSVLEAISPDFSSDDEYALVDRIAELSDIAVPESLADLKNKPVRFTGSIDKEEMSDFVMKSLNIK